MIRLLKELNKFLTGVHMGGATFKDYLDKAAKFRA